MANRVGNALRALGSWIEDRVLIVLPDVIQFPAVFFGTLKIGSVVAMVNVILPAEDYAYYMDYTRTKVAVVHEDALHDAADLERERHLVLGAEHSGGGDGGAVAVRDHVGHAHGGDDLGRSLRCIGWFATCYSRK